MKRILFISLAVCSPAYTAPLLTEDWETGTANGWDIVEYWGYDITVLNGEGHDSVGVLKHNIPDDQADSEWLSKTFASQDGPTYNRFYVRLSSNWRWSPIENKIMYLNWPGSDGWRANISYKIWYSHVLNRRYDPAGVEYLATPGELSINVLYPGSSAKECYLQNVGVYAADPICLQPAEWYCIEWMVDPNTPGSVDGALKMWINETLVLDHENVNVRGSSAIGVHKIKSAPYWNQTVPIRPHPFLNIWFDDIVVDTTYIGGAGPDTTPPTGVITVSD